MNIALILIIIVLILVFLYYHIEIVEKQKIYVIERFHKFYKTYESGIFFRVPFIDRVKIKLNKKENINYSSPIDSKTKDNNLINVNIESISYSISDVEKYTYSHPNFLKDYLPIIIRSINNTLINYNKNELNPNKDKINVEVFDNLKEDDNKFGIQLIEVRISFEI